jgi:asparagine synthase (glutamine-hydrolysing)
MCGIAGFIDCRRGYSAEHWAHTVAAMAAPLRHRGPDDAGAWTDPLAGVGLAHRRLSILDVTPTGHQPMMSARGRFVLTYNGEIYNHAELRAELRAGTRFEDVPTAKYWSRLAPSGASKPRSAKSLVCSRSESGIAPNAR